MGLYLRRRDEAFLLSTTVDAHFSLRTAHESWAQMMPKYLYCAYCTSICMPLNVFFSSARIVNQRGLAVPKHVALMCPSAWGGKTDTYKTSQHKCTHTLYTHRFIHPGTSVVRSIKAAGCPAQTPHGWLLKLASINVGSVQCVNCTCTRNCCFPKRNDGQTPLISF